MREIRHKDGRITGKGYSWLKSAEFDPSSGITLDFSEETIRITGRNLNAETRPNMRLFAGILRHRVPGFRKRMARQSSKLRKGWLLSNEWW